MSAEHYTQLVACGPSALKTFDWCEARETASEGTVYHARVQCHYPNDPIALELCKGLAEKRAKHLALSRSARPRENGILPKL